MVKKKKIPAKYQIWIEAQKKFHLSHTHIQMARELGMNPKKFGKLATHKQQKWKAPLPVFIESLYFKRFKKERPDTVKSVEQTFKGQEKKREERKQRKRLEQKEELPGSNAIPPETRELISTELRKIEKEEKVVIFYACESGSRAWGFESEDSDFDVRFLYLHPPKWYLSIDSGPDVIERPAIDNLDISGWDLRKALTLLRKSNPPLLEWIQSPIVYQRRFPIIKWMRKLAPEYFSPRSCLYHYLHMARGNYREYLKGEEVWVKKYFYVLRPVLACRWIEKDLGMVPLKFETLVVSVVENQALKSAIADLLVKKKSGQELDRGPKIPVIDTFIEEELKRLSLENRERPALSSDIARLDELFHKALAQAWGKKI